MRFYHRARAFVGGYFWRPCPRCGRMFGGHEAKGDPIPLGGGGYLLTCSKC